MQNKPVRTECNVHRLSSFEGNWEGNAMHISGVQQHYGVVSRRTCPANHSSLRQRKRVGGMEVARFTLHDHLSCAKNITHKETGTHE